MMAAGTIAPEATIRRYLSAMATNDLASVLACFTPNALITSPVYGEMPVRRFYERLIADTVRASVDLRTLYRSEHQPERWIAHFGYVWVRRDQPDMATELIDLFELDLSGLIARLRIVIADTPAT